MTEDEIITGVESLTLKLALLGMVCLVVGNIVGALIS